jgi:hypothetical protein
VENVGYKPKYLAFGSRFRSWRRRDSTYLACDIFVQAKKQHRSDFNLLEQKALPTPGDQVGVLGHKKYPNPRQKGDKELTLTRRYLVETL